MAKAPSAKARRSVPAGAPPGWKDDLIAFLALECPFLVDRAREGPDDPDRAEHKLLNALQGGTFVGAGKTLYPGVDAETAASWTRESLEIGIRGFFRRLEIRATLTPDERLLMHRTMLLTRATDDELRRLFVEKKLAWGEFPSPQKGFRSTGQEAVVGIGLRLRRGAEFGRGPAYSGDVSSPLIRDLGMLLLWTGDPEPVFRVQMGKKGTPMDGRDLHIGDFDVGALPSAAPLAIATQTLIGVAYASRLEGSDRVCVSFIGEGGTSLGEWHEAINFAAVHRLNMIFVVENNQWALGTRPAEQTASKRFALKAAGYGIPGVTLFGNDPDEIAAAAAWAAERARGGEGPSLLELVTYRRAGHAHHDDERYLGVPEQRIPGYEVPSERAAWEAVDPISLYEKRLKAEGLLTERAAEKVRKEVARQVADALQRAEAAPWPEPADFLGREFAPRVEPAPKDAPAETLPMAYEEAVRDAMVELMEADPRVFLLGEDIGGGYGGAFAVTRGLAKRFGGDRVLNTPLAESAIVGCAVGAALAGRRPIVEMQFADFLAPAFNALVNNAAKVYWRWGRPVPMVVRLPYGGATGDLKRLLGGGPYHSQCPEAWFLKTPGWKIVAPATPREAKGLLIAAARDGNPMIYLEAKGLYSYFRPDLKEDVPVGSAFEVPIGVARVARVGGDVTLVTYGAMLYTALAAAEKLAGQIAVEVIDLRTLWPLDKGAILRSVAKTSRLAILHEDTKRGGVGAEVAAIVAEEAILELDAPILRIAAPDTPVPYSPPLEHAYMPKVEDVVAGLRRVMER